MQCFIKRYNIIESNPFIDYGITHYYDFLNLPDGIFTGYLSNQYSAPEKIDIKNGTISNGDLILNGVVYGSHAIANVQYGDNTNIIVYGVSELTSLANSGNWIMSISDEQNDFAIGMGRETSGNTYVNNYIRNLSYNETTRIIITKPIVYCYTTTTDQKPVFFAKGVYNDFTKIPIRNFNTPSTIKSEVVLGGYIHNGSKTGSAKTTHRMLAIGNTIHTDEEIQHNIEYLYNKYIASNQRNSVSTLSFDDDDLLQGFDK